MNFEIGQIWNYKNRIGEADSTILILRVETYETQGVVIHISVRDICIKCYADGNTIADEIEHVPITENALLASVTNIADSIACIPDFSQDYNYWKRAFENNKGGVWSLLVNEIVAYTETTINDDLTLQ